MNLIIAVFYRCFNKQQRDRPENLGLNSILLIPAFIFFQHLCQLLRAFDHIFIEKASYNFLITVEPRYNECSNPRSVLN